MSDIAEKNNRGRSILALLVTVILTVAVIFFISEETGAVRDYIRRSGWLGLFISVGIYTLLGASPIPSEPFTILISSVFGPLPATLVAGFGNLGAALVEYSIGHHIGNAVDFTRQKEKLPFGLGKMPVDSVSFLLGARFIPGYGPKLVSLLCGIYRVSIWRYIWTTAISTFSGAAIFAYGGLRVLQLVYHWLRHLINPSIG